MKTLLGLAALSLVVSIVGCAAEDDATDTESANVTLQSKASGYDFKGPKALPNDQRGLACPAVLREEDHACDAVGGESRPVINCRSLCSKPIAKPSKVAGYDFEGFQILAAPSLANELCPGVVSAEEIACGTAGGETSRASGCRFLCTVPIARTGEIAGFDRKGFKVLPIPDGFIACPAVISVDETRCSNVGGQVSRAGCALLCSLPY